MRSEKILHEKSNPFSAQKSNSGPLLMALRAECHNILNSCRLCYLHLVCNIPFANSTVYFMKKKLMKINYKGFVTFISPR